MIKKILFFLLSATTLFAANSLNNVTVSEYSKFLNAVAQEDSHTLYDQKMGEESGVASIERLGTPGNYSYRFNEEQAEESVMFVDLRSAMRFCNWKENGEEEDPVTTEHGVYELEGDQLVSVHIDDTTNYFLPSEQDEEFSSMEGICLRLGSLEDPASWLRSNQVVFHLKGRLENMTASLSHEEPSSLKQDAGYVLGTLAGIAAVAACFKYRDHFYQGRGSGGGSETEKDRSPVFSLKQRKASSLRAAPLKQANEKLLQEEVLTFIKAEIYPRTQMIEFTQPKGGSLIPIKEAFKSQADQVSQKGEEFTRVFKNNLDSICKHSANTWLTVFPHSGFF